MANRKWSLLFTIALAACGGGDADQAGTDGAALSGSITADGSSTVFPISQAVSEEFTRANNGGVQVTVGQSGTGGGFKRFCLGETDISNASRPIKDEEKAICAQNGVEFTEMQVAYDGLSVLAHPSNSFLTCITVPELKKIWEPGSQVERWSEVRSGFPNEEIKLYGPGTASGTFDYFTEVINGKAQASRSDFTQSEDDNVLVQGVSGDPHALGYFGYAYYEQNKEKLKLIPVDGGTGCVTPSPETIKNGTYAPLSRPLFLYISKKALARPEVQGFVKFLNENAVTLIPQVGYVPLDAVKYQENLGSVATTTAQ
ncbi:MAG: PstS family phosphate ABC transporter substrate-binding protein [Gemmatimonadota bacterium]